jgi:hypothetical protein
MKARTSRTSRTSRLSKASTREFSGITEKRFYVAFMATGGLCLAIGMSIPQYGIVVLGIGGAILGAALSNFLTIVNRQDFYSVIYSLLKESLHSQLLSEEDAVSQYASMQTLYQYHLTRTIDHPEGIWALTFYDFSRCGAPNVLEGEATMPRSEGTEQYKYKVEAGVRKNRLLVIATPRSGSEHPWVEIYPNGGNFYASRWVGIMVSQHYLHQDHVSACILSTLPLISHNEPGFIRSTEDEQTLNNLWNSEFHLQCTLPNGLVVKN